MQLKIGILSAAHVHAPEYAKVLSRHSEATLAGVWDTNEERAIQFAHRFQTKRYEKLEDFLHAVDAVIITSENKLHASLGVQAARAGKHILCEKPLVTNEEDGFMLLDATERAGVLLMTAFPCAYSPAFKRAKERVACGEIGKVLALCATNRGQCPWDWFVDPELSGGGAIMDHVVHVIDLMRRLLGEDPVLVQAQAGNNLYGQNWEDTAMLTVEFESGVFGTIDASWSRPDGYKTWGDVTMSILGEKGLLELDLFNQHVELYQHSDNVNYGTREFGSNLNQMLIDDFIAALLQKQTPKVTGYDGLMAARVVFAGYQSVQTGQPVPVRSCL
jgi:predicted dehydrogenase